MRRIGYLIGSIAVVALAITIGATTKDLKRISDEAVSKKQVVLVSEKDECNGVYVKKVRTGFDVYELAGGRAMRVLTGK